MPETTEKKPDKKSRMAGIDVITSIVIMVVSVVIVIWSLNMPRTLGWAKAPGLVPILFAGTMFFMGLALFISAIKTKGIDSLARAISGLSLKALAGDIQTQRTFWIILFTAVYLLILTGRVPFEIAGGLFLFGTFAVFWRKGGWLKIVLVSLVVPLAFSALFRLLFKILLPGDSVFDWFF